MDGIFHELSRKTEPAKLLGYLNFSDGRPDPRFQKGLADAYAHLIESGDANPWRTIPQWLTHELNGLVAAGSPAFRDPTQARAVIDAALVRLPAAYRAHHADLLAHQPDSMLFGPFFLTRCCEAVLKQGAPWDDSGRLVSGAVNQLNDYVGYRPIAVLETRPNTEYYPHEKVRPVPVALAGAGVAPGAYADIIRPALKLLAETELTLLEEASFDPAKLDELAFDPRAHDHFHPINKRPNVLFGEWDPHTIDNSGYFRRFVLRQMTLDTLLTWVTPGPHAVGDTSERLFEAAAVLAGTILMGAGVSGSGPNFHDSSVTLSKLVPRIARYRDAFYQRLLKQLPGAHGERLRDEAEKRKQPFAGVRQFLNQAIATQRASHLQVRRLAQCYAAMGYPAAARTQAAKIAAPAVRFGTEIRIRQTEAAFAADRERPAGAIPLLTEVEDLLRRGIDCGALIDPWNILGYQGLFPIFPGREDTVRDPRAEELIHIAGRQLDLYARASAAAAIANDGVTREALTANMRLFAEWWDKFATSTVTDMPRIVGGERTDAAEHVADALAAWSLRKPNSNDIAFWRQHREGFTSPTAFAQVIEPLVERGEWKAATGLLMTWLSESDTVPLDEPGASFEHLAERWVRGTVVSDPAAERAALIRRFFELLEANAREDWLRPHEWLGDRRTPREDDDEERDPFASAYEGMTYKDSTDDGVEGSIAGDPPEPVGEFSLEAQADEIEDRLGFLHAIAKLWRLAARPEVWERRRRPRERRVAGGLVDCLPAGERFAQPVSRPTHGSHGARTVQRARRDDRIRPPPGDQGPLTGPWRIGVRGSPPGGAGTRGRPRSGAGVAVRERRRRPTSKAGRRRGSRCWSASCGPSVAVMRRSCGSSSRRSRSHSAASRCCTARPPTAGSPATCFRRRRPSRCSKTSSRNSRGLVFCAKRISSRSWRDRWSGTTRRTAVGSAVSINFSAPRSRVWWKRCSPPQPPGATVPPARKGRSRTRSSRSPPSSRISGISTASRCGSPCWKRSATMTTGSR